MADTSPYAAGWDSETSPVTLEEWIESQERWAAEERDRRVLAAATATWWPGAVVMLPGSTLGKVVMAAVHEDRRIAEEGLDG